MSTLENSPVAPRPGERVEVLGKPISRSLSGINWVGLTDEELQSVKQREGLALTDEQVRVRTIARLRRLLAEVAIPLEALRASECDPAGTALAENMKAAIISATEAIRDELVGKSR